MSRKTGRSRRNLRPAKPGEQVSRGMSSEWILSSFSLFLAVACVGPAASGPTVPAAVLAPVEETLRLACGCERFRVGWTIPAAVAAGALSLDSLSAMPDGESVRALAANAAGEPGTGGDRVTVRLRGRQHGRPVEYLAEARPLCGGAVPVARRPVRAGAVLAAEDLEWSDGWFAPSVWHAAVESVEGKAARRALAPGCPIGRDDLAEPALVSRGAAVRVLYRLGAIAISGKGVARQDGRRGDKIGVRLAGASRDCVGLVTGPGEVRVDEEGGGS